jgi:hypothetical protein
MQQTATQQEPIVLRDLLHVYAVHQTGTEVESVAIATETNNETRTLPSHPDWPSDRRRIPPYRSTTRDYPLSDRPAGTGALDEVIVTAMFAGVYSIAVRSSVIFPGKQYVG